MTDTEIWRTDYSAETTAAPDTIWRIFKNVAGWKDWNAGIAEIVIDGPFAAGTWFTMQPPGEAPLRCRLVEVRDNACFVDETRVGDGSSGICRPVLLRRLPLLHRPDRSRRPQ